MTHDASSPAPSRPGNRHRFRVLAGAGGALVLAAGGVAIAQAATDDAPADAWTPAERTTTDDTPRTGSGEGAGAVAVGPAEMCTAEIVFRGRTYTMTGTGTPVEGTGKRLGTATVPPCDDTPGLEQDDDTVSTVTVFEVRNSRVRDAVHADGALWTATR